MLLHAASTILNFHDLFHVEGLFLLGAQVLVDGVLDDAWLDQDAKVRFFGFPIPFFHAEHVFKIFLQLGLNRLKFGLQLVVQLLFCILPSQGSYNLGYKFAWDVSDEGPINIIFS